MHCSAGCVLVTYGAGRELRQMSMSDRTAMLKLVRWPKPFIGAGSRRQWLQVEKATIVAKSEV